MPNNQSLTKWVEECARLCQPDKVVWLDGSEEEREPPDTTGDLESGELFELNQEKLPGCYLHRSALNDVARVGEAHLHLLRTRKSDAGPTNNWMAPD